MSDLRKPGNPGGTRGKSESQKNQGPRECGVKGSSDNTGRSCIPPTTPGKTSGRKGNPVR